MRSINRNLNPMTECNISHQYLKIVISSLIKQFMTFCFIFCVWPCLYLTIRLTRVPPYKIQEHVYFISSKHYPQSCQLSKHCMALSLFKHMTLIRPLTTKTHRQTHHSINFNTKYWSHNNIFTFVCHSLDMNLPDRSCMTVNDIANVTIMPSCL